MSLPKKAEAIRTTDKNPYRHDKNMRFSSKCDGVESDINRYANYKLGSLWCK